MKFKKVFIEITNICGLACTFCPPVNRKTGSMSLQLFEKINQQVAHVTKELAYHIVGDPLTLSNLNEYLNISDKYNLKVNITTSGFFLNESKFILLTHDAIKQVNFSLNSFNANKSKITFDEYMNSIFEFVSYKQSMKKEIFINLRLWNIDDDKSASDFNDKVIAAIKNFFEIDLELANIYLTKPKSIRLDNKVLLNFDEYFEWPNMNNEVETDGFCYGLSSHFGILCDGTVVPCCLDKDGCVKLGNLETQLLDDILNSSLTQNIILGFKQNLAIATLCKKCNYKHKFI